MRDVTAVTRGSPTQDEQSVNNADLIDHHSHIFSPSARHWFERAINKPIPSLTGEQLISVLDADQVRQAVILSVAYMFARPGEGAPSDVAALQAENDWAAAQIAKWPDRLVGFFSVNPIADSSGAEIDRCAPRAEFVGLKLHLANSQVDLRNTSHAKRLAETFAHANALGLVIVIHLRTQRPD